LIKLRWAAVFGQVATIAAVEFGLGVELAWGPLLALVAATALTNLALQAAVFWRQQDSAARESGPWQVVVGGVMLLDLLLLTGLLYFSGGPANPFFVFYLVNLSLAAVVLPANWTWTLTAVAIACFAALFLDYRPVGVLDVPPAMAPAGQTGSLSIPQQGLLAAFSACAGVVVYFMTRLTHELRLREAALRKAEALRARSEKLEALGTLAAGAAHELATPLSTIAVVAKELEADARRLDDASLSEDVRLIRSEVNRCRKILDHLSADAGHSAGEALVRITVDELLDLALEDLPAAERVAIAADDAARQVTLLVPRYAAAQALRGLVKNALDADGKTPVELRVARQDGVLRLLVRDSGPGMSREVLARAGEPFFTTKQPGRGMGLGIFLARSVVERLGGRMELDSTPGKGTTVEVKLPVETN
jgi:two-component system sensor histidine kinase RegB